jgi:hypothetical protein
MKKAPLFAVVLTIQSISALANDPTYQTCRSAVGNNGYQFTQQWQQGIAANSPQIVQQIAGTYQGAVPLDAYVQEQVITYHPTGNVEFRTRNCNPQLPQVPCAEDYGVGRFVAFDAGNGWINLYLNMSSTAFTNACLFNVVSVDAYGIRNSNGAYFQRVR